MYSRRAVAVATPSLYPKAVDTPNEQGNNKPSPPRPQIVTPFVPIYLHLLLRVSITSGSNTTHGSGQHA